MKVGSTPPVQPLVQMLMQQLPQASQRSLAAEPARPPEAAPAPAQLANSAAAPSVAMLVAMAGMPAPDRVPPRQRQVARAARGLDALAALNTAHARGEDPGPALAELEEWLSTADLPAEGPLAELLRDLDLRVRVERARHERLA